MRAKTKVSIEDKIREVAVGKFPEFSYVFEDWKGADEAVDKIDLPAIISILPVGGRLEFRNGRVRDHENCAVAFIDKVARDADGDDNEGVYTAMKETAGKFIQELNKSGYFEPIEDEVRYTTIYESMSTNVTGVFVELTLRELVGMCV